MLKKKNPPQHECPRNYEGLSKGMEAQNVLFLLLKLNQESEGKVFLQYIIADNYTSLRSILKHTSPTTKKGKLPDKVPEPECLANPCHQTKTACKPIFALVKIKKSESTCSRVDALRFMKYDAYMLRTNCEKSIDKICEAAQAVLEHLFNNHQYCDESWCHTNRKQEQR